MSILSGNNNDINGINANNIDSAMTFEKITSQIAKNCRDASEQMQKLSSSSNFDSSLKQLNDISREISNIGNAMAQLKSVDSSAPIQIEDFSNRIKALVDNFKSLSNTSISADVLSPLTKSLDDIKSSITEVFNSINNAMSNIDLTRVNNMISGSIDTASNAGRTISESMNKASESIESADKQVVNFNIDIDKLNKSKIIDETSLLSVAALSGNFKDLQINLKDTQLNTVALFNELKAMDAVLGSSSKSLEGLSSVYSELAKGKREIDIMLKSVMDASAKNGPDVNNFLGDFSAQMSKILDSTKVEISNFNSDINEMMSKGLDASANLTLSGLKSLIDDTTNNVQNVEQSLRGMLTTAKNNKSAMEDAQQYRKDHGQNGQMMSEDEFSRAQKYNQDLIDNLENNMEKRIKDYKEKVKSVVDDYKKVETDSFSKLIEKVSNNDGDMSKYLGFITGNKTLSSYEHNVANTGSAANALINQTSDIDYNRGNMSLTKQLRSMAAFDNKDLKDNAEKINDLVTLLIHTRDKTIGEINKSMEEYAKHGNESAKQEAMEKLQPLLDMQERINKLTMDMKNDINVNSKGKYNGLATEDKKTYDSANQLVKGAIVSSEDIVELATKIGPEALESSKGIQGLVDQLKTWDTEMDKTSGKMKGFWGNLTESISDFFSPLGGISKALGVIGLGSLPITLGGLSSYKNAVLGDYNTQGRMTSDSTKTEFGMGDYINLPGTRNRVNDQAEYYYKMSNGVIGLQDYNNSYNNLAKNVGGQYGASDQQSVADLQTITDKTFMMQKMYDVSSGTMASAVQTFYKDLKMGASEASYTIMNLAQTATSSNVPVEKYVQTVTNLVSQFRNMGLDGKSAVGMMDNLMSQGMRFEDAQNLTQDAGKAASNFGENNTMMAYNGLMTGTFANSWSAIRYGIDKYDANGDTREGYGQTMAKLMDNWVSTKAGLGGNNEDVKYKLIYDSLKDMGFSQKDADIGADKFLKDPKTFEEWMQTAQTDQEKAEDMNQKLINQMATVGDQLSGLDKISATLAASQWATANNIKDLLDPALGTLQEAVIKLTSKIEEAIKSIAGGVESILNSKFFKDVAAPAGNFVMDHLPETALAYLGIKAGGGTLIKKGVSSLFGGTEKAAADAGTKSESLLSKIFGGGSKAAAETEADVAAKSENILSKIAGSGLGKAGLIGGGVLAGGLLLSKLFGGKSDSEQNVDTSSMSTDGKNIYNKLDDIHKDIIGTQYGTSINSPYGTLTKPGVVYPSGYTENGDYVGPTTSNPSINASVKSTKTNITSALQPQQNSSDANLMGGILGGAAYYGVNKFVSLETSPTIKANSAISAAQANEAKLTKDLADAQAKLQTATDKHIPGDAAGKLAEDAAKQDVAKLTADVAKASEGTKAAQLALEESSKGISGTLGKLAITTGGKAVLEGGTAAIADIVMGGADYLGHKIKGDSVSGDGARVVAQTGSDIAWTAIGTAIGTVIAPGIGTTLGAMFGSTIGTGINSLTKDASGRGINDKAEDAFTKMFAGGQTVEDINKKRDLLNGDDKQKAIDQFVSLGYNKDVAKDMVNSLQKYGDSLQGFTGDTKLLWADTYEKLKANGATETEAVSEAMRVITDGKLKDQMAAANAQSLQEVFANQGIKITVEQAKKLASDAGLNANDYLDIDQKKAENTQNALLKLIDQKKGNVDGYTGFNNMTAKQIYDLAQDSSKDKPMHDMAKKLVDSLTSEAQKQGEKATDSYAQQKVADQNKKQENVNKDVDQGVYQLFNQKDYMVKDLQDQLDQANKMAKATLGDRSHGVYTARAEELQKAINTINQPGKFDSVKSIYSNQYDKQDAEYKATHSRDEYIAEQMTKFISEFDNGAANAIKQKHDELIKNVNTELEQGSTATLDKLQSMNKTIAGAADAFNTIMDNLSRLQQKGYIGITDSEMITPTLDRKTAQRNLINVDLGLSSSATKGTAAAAYARSLTDSGVPFLVGGNDINGLDSQGFLKYVGQLAGTLDSNFTTSDLTSSKFKTSAASSAKFGDIVYNTEEISDQDEMEYGKKYNNLKKQGYSDEQIKAKLGDIKPKVTSTGVYLGDNKVATMTADGLKTKSLSEFSFAAENSKDNDKYAKAATDAASTTNSALFTASDSQIKSMKELSEDEKQHLISIKDEINSGTATQVQKLTDISQYLSNLPAYILKAAGSGDSSALGALPIDNLTQKITNTIMSHEGSYSSVNPNDNGALSVGKIQWHGDRARDLLKTIQTMDPQLYSTVMQNAGGRLPSLDSEWKSFVPTSSQQKSISSLLDSEPGRQAQNILAEQNVAVYMQHIKGLGITDPGALEFLSDVENQGGAGAAERIARAANGTSLQALYQAALSDPIMGSGSNKSRRTSVYNDALSMVGSNPGTGSTATTASASTNIATAMVNWSKQQIGKPYVWGAEGLQDWDGDGNKPSIDNNGITHDTNLEAYDCSGLVSAAAHFAGLNIGRLTAEQLRSKCNPISKDQLQPGDLGFILTGGSATHVGLYEGNGKWVEAANSATGVVESNGTSFTTFGRLPGVGNASTSPDLALTMPTVQNGSSGDAVKTLQQQLNSNGANLSVDGIFGPLTQNALKSYQSKNGLTADGVANTDDWKKLMGYTAPSSTTSADASANAVDPNDPFSKTKLSGDPFTDGTLLYNLIPASARSSYMNNNSNSQTNWLDITKSILNSTSNVELPNQQTEARTMRVDADNNFFKDSAFKDDFTYDMNPDIARAYEQSVSSISGVVSDPSALPNKNYSVSFSLDKNGVDDDEFNQFSQKVMSYIQSLGGKVVAVENDVTSVKSSLASTVATISSNNKWIADNNSNNY